MMAAVEWPTLVELKATLDVQSNDWDDQLGRSLEAAIEHVKHDVGDWDDDTDYPDDALAAAALRAAVLMPPNAADVSKIVGKDEIYVENLKGHRRRFGIG